MAKLTEDQKKVRADRKKMQEQEFAKIFNPKAFVDTKKEDFMKQYKGKVPHDLDTVWKWIDKNRKD